MRSGRTIALARAGAVLTVWLTWPTTAAPQSRPLPDVVPFEIFSERLHQAHPVVAADPLREVFSVVGHSQDRLAIRSVAAGDHPERGPVRSLDAWPAHWLFDSWGVSVEPTRGRSLAVWSERSFDDAPGRLLAQGLSAAGRRLGPPIELDRGGYLFTAVEIVYVPWRRIWLVVWEKDNQISLRTVRRNARAAGPLRRTDLRLAPGGTDEFDLAVDTDRRRVLVVGRGTPRGSGVSARVQLMVWFLDLTGERVARELSLGRYRGAPAIAHDPSGSRFLVIWPDRGKLKGKFLKRRRPSERFVIHRAPARHVELAWAPGNGGFLVAWLDPDVVIEGRGSVPIQFTRWLDAGGLPVGEPEPLAILQYSQILGDDYVACVSSGCLVAWQADRGLSRGTFIERDAIAGTFLPTPD